MDRLIAPNTVNLAGADTAPAAGAPGYATDGDPVGGVPATIFPAYAWNMLQEEIRAAIVAAGLVPDKDNWGQLALAISALAGGRGYVLLQDQKAAGTNGGTFTLGAWRTRDLNTEVVDTAGICALAANQFTLPAGTYRVNGWATAVNVDSNIAKIRNVTDGADALIGSNAQATTPGTGDAASSLSMLSGQFTIAAPKTFELQHQCYSTQASYGFGIAHNNGLSFGVTEIYSSLEIQKVA